MSNDEPMVELAQVRAAWWLRQGLEQRTDDLPVQALERHGWMYAGNICAPHLACFARLAELVREDVDTAVTGGAALDVSTVRGCGMVVPFEDAGLALRMGRIELDKRLAAAERKLGFDPATLPRLEEAVVAALDAGALSPRDLKGAVPDELLVAFGDAGKKLGESTNLPLALRSLEAAGRVRRISADGRLDSARYVYELAPRNPLEEADLPEDDAGVFARLAARFCAWAGPATADEFAWWAGLPKGKAKRAIADAGLATVAVDGWAADAHLPAEDLDDLLALDPELPSSVRFLPIRDNYLYFRREAWLFTDEDPHEIRVLSTRMQPQTLAEAGSIFSQTIFHGGRLVGLWEHDPDGEDGPEVHVRLYPDLGTRIEADVEQARAELETFIVDELGNPATWPMDSAKRRATRLAALDEV